MGDAVEVSQTQYDEVTKLLEVSRRTRELSKIRGLTLNKKLELIRLADEYAAKALAVGRS